MTNNLAITIGAVLTAAAIPGADDIAQLGLSITGGGLLTWIAIMQGRELKTLRQENRDLSRELGRKCKNCDLAQQANRMLSDAGADYMHEKD